jgi:hypothetical protein
MFNLNADLKKQGRGMPLSERMQVLTTAAGVQLKVTGGPGAGNWHFRWGDISHYAHEEGYFWNSDAIVLTLGDERHCVAIPTEAVGAHECYEMLVRKCPRPGPGVRPVRVEAGAPKAVETLEVSGP